jgi:hypothetical protein
MKFSILAVAGALALAGCAQGGLTPLDTATMPLNPSGGPKLNQNEAIALASWALKDPANTAGHPGWAARALAAEDWLAGQTQLYGNFGSYSPGGELSWAQFRQQARAAIGVAPGAPSQQVVDRLLATADALDAGHADAAKAQLAAPIFSLGPDGTLRALGNLPPLPGRDWAFAELDRNEDRSLGGHQPGIFH